MKLYTHKDIADEVGCFHSAVCDIKRLNPKLFPKGKLIKRVFYYTAKEKEKFIQAYHQKNVPKHIFDGLKSGELMYQKDAAIYLGISPSNYSKIKTVLDGVPFEQFRRFKIFKKSDIDKVEFDETQTGEYQELRAKSRREQRYKKNIEIKREMEETMIQPYCGPKHECCVPECRNITTNRLMCNSCKEANLGCIGDM